MNGKLDFPNGNWAFDEMDTSGAFLEALAVTFTRAGDHISLNELKFKLSFSAKKKHFIDFHHPRLFPSSHSRGCAALLFLIIHKPCYTEKKRPLLSLQNTMWTTSHKTKTNKNALWREKKQLVTFSLSVASEKKRQQKIIKVREIISRKAPLMWKREIFELEHIGKGAHRWLVK